jgi:hypothetical protein
MSRRSSVAAVVAACALPAGVGAHAADAPPIEPPRLNCTKRWTDTEGDAYTNVGTSANKIPATGLDIVSMFFRTTPDQVQVFLKLKDIPAPASMQAYDLAYRYNVTFKHGAQVFTFANEQVNPTYAQAFTGKTYPESAPPATGVTGTVDPATDIVSVSVPRAQVELKAAGTPVVDGESFTGISATAEWLVQNSRPYTSDELKPAADAASWVIGDDYCFGPPPASLSELAAPAVQYGDVTKLSAKLLDEAGAPLANEQVSFAVAGAAAPVTGTTDADGVATVSYPAAVLAGSHAVTASYAGTATAGKAVTSGVLTVKTEVTKFLALAVKKTSTTARAVTATLRDDDGKAVAGQKVGWYVNGKLVSTLTTDATGRSVFKAAKAGQTVQARFAGVSGKYVASKSNTPKV